MCYLWKNKALKRLNEKVYSLQGVKLNVLQMKSDKLK